MNDVVEEQRCDVRPCTKPGREADSGHQDEYMDEREDTADIDEENGQLHVNEGDDVGK